MSSDVKLLNTRCVQDGATLPDSAMTKAIGSRSTAFAKNSPRGLYNQMVVAPSANAGATIYRV
jgi:hypothetical protein